MTTKEVSIDNYLLKDDTLIKVTSTSGTKVNATINPSDLSGIVVNEAALLAAGFENVSGKFYCPFAHYISVYLSRGDMEIGGNVRIPLPPLHQIQNIIKALTSQSLIIDEEALRDAVLGSDLASPIVTLTSRSSTGFILGWAAVPNAAGYQVSIDDGVTFGETQEALTFSKADAVASTEYKIQVVAKVAEGSIYRDSYPGEITVTTLTPLAAPVVTAGTVAATSFDVSWPAVENAAGYQVSIDNGVTFGETQVGLAFEKMDAIAETTYNVVVKAIADGESIYENSPASTAVEVITPAE